MSEVSLTGEYWLLTTGVQEESQPRAAVRCGIALAAIREAVAQQHGLEVSDVQLVPAGSIPRTTSGKLARWASRAGYLDGTLAPARSSR